MKLIAILAFSVACLASSVAIAGDAAAVWELKGQKLGMTKEASLALAPNATCKEYAPGVDMCIDSTATFAGSPAHLVLKFLDGKLISVTANQLDWQKAEEAGAGLVQKFGPADRQAARSTHVMDRRGTISSTYRLWQDGDIALAVEPFEDVKEGNYFASVDLSDTAVHDQVWLPRAKGQKVAASSDL